MERRYFVIRFQDPSMQRHYEDLIRHGMHWKRADRKTRYVFGEYDNAKY